MCRHGRAFIVVLAATAASPLAAEEICGVTDAVLTDSFEPANILPLYTLPGDATPLTLSVANPPDNASMGVDRIVLQGNFTGPPNTGIVAGDRIAARSNTQFVTPPIPLKPGANAITVQLHSIDGPGPSVVHHITYDPALAPRVRVLPGNVSAMAPTTVAFHVEKKTGEPLSITRIRLDTNGDGSIDIDTTSVDAIKAAYSQPGLVKVTGTATLDDSNANTPAVDVPLSTWFLAQHPHQTRYTLCSAFGTMRKRLAASNVNAALQTLIPDMRDRYEPVWNALAPQLPSIATDLGTVVDGRFSTKMAELLVARPNDGQPPSSTAHRIQFEVGVDGVWRVSAM